MTRKVIALTGGIGSGKSAVAQYLRQKGFVTVDCDQLSRQVAENQQLIFQVKQLLGDECVTDGKLNRARIREIIFVDASLHEQYSNLFYDKIKQLLCDFVDKSNESVFVEIPLMNAFEFEWDEIWLVERDAQMRISSVMTRDGVDRSDVENIIARQKICNDFTVKIDNNGTLEQLYRQVDIALKNAELQLKT